MMKQRHVFSTPSITIAQDVIQAALAAGVEDDHIFLVARDDIEMDAIPSDRIDASMDTVPAALRGAIGGGSAGLLAGLIAIAFPPIGVTVAGIGALTAVGALTGTWSAALFGSGLDNNVRDQYSKEIEAGRILVIIEADDALEKHAREPMVSAGATRLAQQPHDLVR